MTWFNYDEVFRQKLAVHRGLRWGMKDVGLWHECSLCSGGHPAQKCFRKLSGGALVQSSTREYLLKSLESGEVAKNAQMDKLVKFKNVVNIMLTKKVLLKELQSLLGMLVFASRLMPMGRIFSKRLSALTIGLKSPNCHVKLTKEVKEDLIVWQQFLQTYNGRSLWQQEFAVASDLQIFTDAAGSEGFRAYWAGHWCVGSWPETWKEIGLTKNLVLLELFPVVVTIVVWGKYFVGKRLLFNCDNMGVVLSVNNLSSKSAEVVRLLRHLVLCCLVNNIWVRAKHILGTRNEIADALSRFQLQRFQRLAPEADKESTDCPQHLWGLILPD
ncbi:hypothetical protein XELAEV_18037310mg [Xenopus laevis]|uniref:RNase H type-1 domain-containing protein n=1 Tax=Xenopus laevis TaxID=8355 RepID=A0A974CCJ3_XENLA|nr:hypothetical protein XELAEV_18037310mg [Xenopus laevis]